MLRFPVVIRAIIMGLVVTLAAALPGGLLVQANLRIGTQLPWAAPAAASDFRCRLGRDLWNPRLFERIDCPRHRSP